MFVKGKEMTENAATRIYQGDILLMLMETLVNQEKM